MNMRGVLGQHPYRYGCDVALVDQRRGGDAGTADDIPATDRILPARGLRPALAPGPGRGLRRGLRAMPGAAGTRPARPATIQDLVRRYDLNTTLDREHFHPSLDQAFDAINNAAEDSPMPPDEGMPPP